MSELQITDYLPLIKVLFSDFIYVKALSYTVDQADYDALAKAIVNIGIGINRTLPLTKDVIESEFERNMATPGSILRGNCVASKVMGAYSRLVGKEWMNSCLGSLIGELCAQEDLSMEIDPPKVQPNDTLEHNRDLLIAKCESILNQIIDERMLDDLPIEIKAMAGFTAKLAQKYAPDRVIPLVGGFFFLRLVNPALVTPEAYGMTPSLPSKNPRRNLTLISKILQNLSNGVEFGKKEEYMTECNSFILNNQEKMNDYLSRLAAKAIESSEGLIIDTTSELIIPESDVKMADLKVLHKMIHGCREKLQQNLSTEIQKLENSPSISQEQFFQILDTLGPYIDASKSAAAGGGGFTKKNLDINALLAQADAMDQDSKKKKSKDEKKSKDKDKESKEKPVNEKLVKLQKKQKKKRAPKAFGRFLFDDEELPSFIHDIIDVLQQVAMETEGLFRKTASQAAIEEIITKYESNEGEVEWAKVQDHHLLGGVFMAYLLRLPEPPITFDTYDELLQAVQIPDRNMLLSSVKATLAKLPPKNYELLDMIIDFLDTITMDAEDNLMTADNLAICFAPALLKSENDTDLTKIMRETPLVNRAVTTLINYYGFLFKDEALDAEQATPTSQSSANLKDFATQVINQVETNANTITLVVNNLEWPDMWNGDALCSALLYSQVLEQLLKKEPIDVKAILADPQPHLSSFTPVLQSTPKDRLCAMLKDSIKQKKTQIIDLVGNLAQQQKFTKEELLAFSKIALAIKQLNDFIANKAKSDSSSEDDVAFLLSAIPQITEKLQKLQSLLNSTKFLSDAQGISKIMRAIQKALKERTKAPMSELGDLRREFRPSGTTPAKGEKTKITTIQDMLEHSFAQVEKLLTSVRDAVENPDTQGEAQKDAALIKESLKVLNNFLKDPEPMVEATPHSKAAPPPVAAHPKAAVGPPPVAAHPKAASGAPPPAAAHPKAAVGPPPVAAHPKAASGAPPPVASHPRASAIPPPFTSHPRDAISQPPSIPPPLASHPRKSAGPSPVPPPIAAHPRAPTGIPSPSGRSAAVSPSSKDQKSKK